MLWRSIESTLLERAFGVRWTFENLSLLSLSTGERGYIGVRLSALSWDGAWGLDGLSFTPLSYLSPLEREDAAEVD
jgi:hypothetical protein